MFLALSVVLAPVLITDVADAKTRKPTLQEIAAAKAKEVAKAKAAIAAKAKLDAAAARLKVLAAKAAAAKAILDREKAELQAAKDFSAVATRKTALAEAVVESANQQIGSIAAGAYKMGGGFTSLNSLLESDGPADLIDRLNTLGVVSNNTNLALSRLESARDAAVKAKVEADKARAAQASATEKVRVAKVTADVVKANQKKEVDSLMSVQNALAKQLASARNVRVTLEQQRKLAILEEQSANTAATTSGQARIWPDRGLTGRQTIRTTAEQRQVALNFAIKEVKSGKPYVWGAQGPNSYDCSGLVYAAYKNAGLTWTTWSRLNAALFFVATKRVPLAELQPGDLVFWSYNGSVQAIHHIAIYAGNNMVWEARNTRAGLKYSSIYGMDGLMPSGGRV
ncbi:MAG: NlpC/P60 family protein [Actinobacteria bacterium]|nr:NlpC/P60 family protein [Actinomycetota bacterium]MSY27407.1 NlpC/P60 family protein [Actinomycetota bacterium]MSZ87509.1 NlpC/P60 family protein [Actinomycetota bacterium]MTB14286.1 NlpC/P60 family protein [Actinomycetota bacterium]MTB25833.1 NlpC/P60 family protein [Actinomycetota bacterium]